jgi:dTDP-4-dehydrorhamnose reductase
MRLLVFGSNGQLGHDLMTQSQARGWEPIGADLPACDITRAESIDATFDGAGRIAAVINAAAYTAVDAAESNVDLAFAVNRNAVELLAKACARCGAPLIHVSTDYVFDGFKTRAYLPEDPLNPQGVYGRSKAEGEAVLRRHWERHAIVRTSWLFGVHGANFVKTMLRLGRERDTLRVVDDQVGCPTYAADLAAALLTIAAQVAERKDSWGTYHFCNDVPVTWYAFTRRILALARPYERFRATEILPILTAHYPLPAPRPTFSVLDCSSLEQTFGIQRRSWEAALKEMLRVLYTGQ